MKFIIGYKKEMTQQYREDGTIVPVTVVKAEPVVVTQIKTPEKEGYSSVQLGLGSKKRINKSLAGHLAPLAKAGAKPYKDLREIRVEDTNLFKVGDVISATAFEPGDKVAVTGVSKGKGFQGVVKRHGFHGSPASHGHKDQLRMPGSIGAQDAQRVFKGTRMGGRTGGDRVTVKNLEIVSVDPENNLLFVKGALPGARNSMIYIAGEGDLGDLSNLFVEDKPAPQEKEEDKAEAEENEEPSKEIEEKESTADAIKEPSKENTSTENN